MLLSLEELLVEATWLNDLRMLSLNDLISFAPITLILHCIAIFGLNHWLGPVGTFYGSLMTLSFTIVVVFWDILIVLNFGSYMFIDFGRFFFCLDLIDSHLVFCTDKLALVCATLVLTLTMFALYFGVEYMYSDSFINRLLYLLNMFATSVTFLFFCGDLFLIMFFWECVGLFSFLLVNFYSTRVYTINAALNTFVFSRISDMFLFIAFILAVVVLNTTDVSIIFLQSPLISFHYTYIGGYSTHFLTMFTYCIVISGTINSAQFLAHVWLPDAMEAPTPASALIHSSTLVVAGVFLVLRFTVLFEFTTNVNSFLALLGGITLAFSSVTAIFQNDVNKLVAYSTISQIGYLVCGCGFLCYEEVLLYLITHALNNAFLFVLVGYIVHFFAGNTDMRQMGGFFLYSFDISVFFFGVCFNLSGLPFSAGFLGNEFLLYQILRDDVVAMYVRACWLVSFFFTPTYMFILVFVVLFGPNNGNLSTYAPFWSFTGTHNNQLLINRESEGAEISNMSRTLTPNYQFTAVTSRLTTYVLFSFWCFFLCCGESLMLILFNYNTLIDLIPSSFFIYTNSHYVFQTFTSSSTLSNLLMLIIFFFTAMSYLLLSTLTQFSNYNYLTTTFQIEILLVGVSLYLFYPTYCIILAVYSILHLTIQLNATTPR